MPANAHALYPLNIHPTFNTNYNNNHIIPQSAPPKGAAYFIFIPSEGMLYFAVLLSERFPSPLTKTLPPFKHSSHGSVRCLLSILFINLPGLFLHSDRRSTNAPSTPRILPREMQTPPTRHPQRQRVNMSHNST